MLAFARFWPGMLLLARISISIASGIDVSNYSRVSASLGTTLLVLISLLVTAALVQPKLYRIRLLDTLEYFFLLNLAILNLIIGLSIIELHSHQHIIFFDTLVGSALLVFTGIICYHLWLRIRHFRMGVCIGRHLNGCWLRFSTRFKRNNRLVSYPNRDDEYEPLLES